MGLSKTFTSISNKSRISIVLMSLMVLLIAVPSVYATVTNNTVVIGSSGAIKAIGVNVYWDSACTNAISSVNWGNSIEAGSTETKTIHVKNSGNSPITLSLDTSNWNPSSAANYISLDWDYNGQSINADQVVEITLTLSISSSVSSITGFSFDIVISASG